MIAYVGGRVDHVGDASTGKTLIPRCAISSSVSELKLNTGVPSAGPWSVCRSVCKVLVV